MIVHASIYILYGYSKGKKRDALFSLIIEKARELEKRIQDSLTHAFMLYEMPVLRFLNLLYIIYTRKINLDACLLIYWQPEYIANRAN